MFDKNSPWNPTKIIDLQPVRQAAEKFADSLDHFKGVSVAEVELWYNEINDIIHHMDDDGSGILDQLVDLRDEMYSVLRG